ERFFGPAIGVNFFAVGVLVCSSGAGICLLPIVFFWLLSAVAGLHVGTASLCRAEQAFKDQECVSRVCIQIPSSRQLIAFWVVAVIWVLFELDHTPIRTSPDWKLSRWSLDAVGHRSADRCRELWRGVGDGAAQRCGFRDDGAHRTELMARRVPK